MRRLRLTLEYDGSDFQGWQLQDQGRSVQGVLEEAIAKVTLETERVVAASRTDAGVHALGQTAHCDSGSRLSALDLRGALNAELPRDVAVRELIEVPPEFHARHDALSKRYVYRIWNGPVPSPLQRRFSWHVRGRLDVDSMAAAAAALLGEHDFAAYRGSHGGAQARETTVRSLDRLDVLREGDELHVVAEGRSFLRYMVRNLVGTLVEVGHGRCEPQRPAQLLESRDRALAGPTAPPHGLCLERVFYPEE